MRKQGAKNVIAEVPGFCRGLDFIQNFAIIGLSQIRETAVFAGLPLTEREQERKCGVWIVDINTGQTVCVFIFLRRRSRNIFHTAPSLEVPCSFGHERSPTAYAASQFQTTQFAQFVAPDPKQVKMDQAVGHHRRKEFDKAIALYEECLQE